MRMKKINGRKVIQFKASASSSASFDPNDYLKEISFTFAEVSENDYGHSWRFSFTTIEFEEMIKSYALFKEHASIRRGLPQMKHFTDLPIDEKSIKDR